MSKSSIDVTYVPRAEATGRVEIRPECMVSEVTVGPDGKARSVIYFDSLKQQHELAARSSPPIAQHMRSWYRTRRTDFRLTMPVAFAGS